MGAGKGEDYSLGELAIRAGLVNFEQVQDCIAHQQRDDQGSKKLGQILVEKGLLTKLQVQDLLAHQVLHRAGPIPGYEILERIGQGAMGTVFRVRQLSVGRDVALKILPDEVSKDPRFTERFLRETRAIAKLSHPNIVSGIDAGRVGNAYYYVMELVEGHSAQDLLKVHGRLNESTCLSIALQAARALAHIAAHGLVHRDIKPVNILVTNEGIVKLCDLGLAKEIGNGSDPSITQAGLTVGTPYYISPEQARSDLNVDIRSDIYSLGATLYHLASGTPPFVGNTAYDVIAQHLEAPAPSLRRVVPSISPEFEALVLRMLEKDPKNRFTSADDLVHKLERLTAPRRPTTRRHDRRRATMRYLRAPRSASQLSTLFGIVIALLVLLLILLALKAPPVRSVSVGSPPSLLR